MSLSVQFLTLWAMAACGFALGLCYDAYRVCSRQFRFPRWFISVFDLLYWAAAAVLVFRTLAAINNGQVRVFVFAGLFAGCGIYFATISRWVVWLIRQIIAIAYVVLRWLEKCFRFAVIVPIKGLWRLLWLFCGFFAAVSIFIGKIMLQLLYPVRILFVFLARPLSRAVRPVGRLAGRVGKFAIRLKRFFLK